MSVSFDITSSTGTYGVRIAPGLYDSLKAADSRTIVMCDARFADDLRAAGLQVIALEADERQKSLDAIPDLIVRLRQLGANRKTHLLAIGGGIVQDAAAFCASVFMRGIAWTYAPTTLLGMADSCIGGKSSINVGDFKNIVGTFYPPQQVLVDPALCATLSADQWAAGLIEAAKICYCRDGATYAAYQSLAPRMFMDTAPLAEVITLSLRAKTWFIETDEFDQGPRLLLNFGHTFGHAIEGASHFAVSHGVAVGLGCVAALHLARQLGIDVDALPQAAHYEQHMHDLLAQVPDLAQQLSGLSSATLLDRFAGDKKHGPAHYNVVTIDAEGAAVLIPLEKTDASRKMISSAFDAVLARYCAETSGVQTSEVEVRDHGSAVSA